MKKLLLLIPTVAMILATGCAKEKEEEDEEETCPPFSSEIYGDKEHPLTVAKLQANVKANVEAAEAQFSCYPFYVEAYVDQNAGYDSSYNTWNTFYLKDDITKKGDGFKVQRATSPGLALGDTLCMGDKILIHGYAEYYSGSYSFFPKDGEAPEIEECTRGKGKFSVQATSDITYSIEGEDPIKTQYPNMTKLIMTATTSKTNFSVIVKSNGANLTPREDGKYVLYVRGDTAINISSEYSGPREAVPAGTYPITITPANTGLGKAKGTSDTVTPFALVPDDEANEHFYKRVLGTWNKYCYNNPNYANEIAFDKTNGQVIFNAEIGVFTNVKIEYFSGRASDARVFKDGSTKDTMKAKGVQDTDPSHTTYQNCVVYNYDVSDANTNVINIKSGTSGEHQIYQITLTVVVA